MKSRNSRRLSWILIFIAGFGCLFAAIAMADNDHGHRGHFEREDRNSAPLLKSGDEGNETAGQLAAWLLLVANMPVVMSLLIKGTNRFAHLRAGVHQTLANLNQMQKKALMRLHYYLNPAILGIALWHWLSSRCKTSALPEIGLMMMAALVVLGFLIKFKLCPKAFRKYAYQAHTQPAIFISLFLVLTVGHLIVD